MRTFSQKVQLHILSDCWPFKTKAKEDAGQIAWPRYHHPESSTSEIVRNLGFTGRKTQNHLHSGDKGTILDATLVLRISLAQRPKLMKEAQIPTRWDSLKTLS